MRAPQTLLAGIALSIAAAVPAHTQTSAVLPGANVNMVSGTQWPDGDPFLQRQNEPSIAVSTRNPLHLLAGANDYRTVDLPGLPEGKETGDAWLGVFRSVDGGASWKSTLIGGYPQDQGPGRNSPIHGYEAAADPVVRAGTNGLFYYSGIVFDRSLQRSAAFVARFMDLNNETVEPVRYVDTVVVDSFDELPTGGGPFIDKPWLEVDIPRQGAQLVTLGVSQGSSSVSQTISCGNVYMAWAEITGQGAAVRTRIMFSRSTDCGASWSNPVPLSPSDATGHGLTVGQGATIAVAPATGKVYVAWRQFHSATADCVQEKGYWKSNCRAWPVLSLVVGGKNYSKADAIVILQKTYPTSDASGTLAQQLISAKLNALSGADDEPVHQTIIDADAWLVRFPLGSRPSSAQKQPGLALKDKLEAFNKGLTGSPACTAATTSYPDAVLVVSSVDAGLTFSAPRQVATVSPFDQGTSEYSFRTNAYPTMAVDETGRAYLAWATRGLATPNSDAVAGDARIVVTTSKNGTTWTAPKPIDQPKLPGHQLFPALTYNAGKLVLVYNDYRADASGIFERFVVDLLDPSHPKRHTADVRVAVASPADSPVFTDYSILTGTTPRKPSSQVSRYPFIVTGSGVDDATNLQVQYNPPNLPMFELGHKPFFGDYHDVAGAPRFVRKNGSWAYNTDASTAPVFHAVWTDNRDVVGPPDGDWTRYVPPGEAHTSPFDGSQVPGCQSKADADRTQMRNQNIYTSRLTSGLFVAVPSNSRPLFPDRLRAFVVFVQNATNAARQFDLKILNQPAGGTASFGQFASVTVQSSVPIGPYSSISQTVFVKSIDPTASVDVQATETGGCSSACLTSTVRINPDPSNPGPADSTLATGETYNPAALNPEEYNPAVLNPVLLNPAALQLDRGNPAVLNYDVRDPLAVYSEDVLNPDVSRDDILKALNLMAMSAALLNPTAYNPAVWNPAVWNPAVWNPAVWNPAVWNPAVWNPAVWNPAVWNPAVWNPAVWNPAVWNPAVWNTALAERSVTEANYVAQNAGNATMAYSFNLDLANQQPGLTYQLMIHRLYFVPVANGCELTEAAQQELLVNDLAPNLNANLLDPNGGDSFFLNPGDVAIITLRVTPDPNLQSPGDPSKFNIDELSASVVAKGVNSDAFANGDTQPSFVPVLPSTVPPLLITTTALPIGVVGTPYGPFSLAATGGAGARTWIVAPGFALPPGLSLSTSGELTGTPSVDGSFNLTVRVSDSTQAVEKALNLSISATSSGILWARQFGTSGAEEARAIAVGASSVYVAGVTSATLPGQSGSGGWDAFIRKYDLDGNEIWTRQFGTASDDRAYGVSVDASGVYVVGSTDGAFPGQTSAGQVDAFIRKYDLAGNLLWTRQFGTAGNEGAAGVSSEPSGVYVTGGAQGALPGQTSSGGHDAFVRKYDQSGTELWTHQFGTTYDDSGIAVSADASGVYVAGSTYGALPGQTSSGGADAFVRKYDRAGTEQWTHQVGTAAADFGTGVSVDASGVYVAGDTLGTLPGQTSSGGQDVFVRKYDLSGDELWTRQLGSDGTEYVVGLSTDASGVYLAGYTDGTLPGQTSSGNFDAFARKYDLTGSELWTLQFGSASNDSPYGISIDASGVYAAGATYGTFAGQSSAGGSDALVVRLNLPVAGSVPWTRQFGTDNEDVARGIVIDASGVYVAGWQNGNDPMHPFAGALVRKYNFAGNELWTNGWETWGNDSADGICLDASGLYVAGYSSNPLPGQTSWGVVVRRYDLAGNVLWTRQFATAADDHVSGIASDGSGVYVAGYTSGTFPGQTSSAGLDGFLRKYDLDGNEVWTRQFATAAAFGNVWVYGVSAGAAGVFVAGNTDGTLPGQTSLGGYDAFLRKYDLDGSEIWTRQFGTAASEGASGVSADGSGVYVAGGTAGALPGQANSGGYDAFLRKYDLDGNEVWTRQFGGAANDSADGVSVGDSGVYVAGDTAGTLPGQTSSGGQDAFACKYDFDGNEVWTRQFGTAGDDSAFAVSSVASSAYAVGYTTGTFPGQPHGALWGDAFVVKLVE